MNPIIVNTLKAAYLKHVLLDDSISWDELSDMLCNALCEALGDEGYCDWQKETTPKELTQKREGEL